MAFFVVIAGKTVMCGAEAPVLPSLPVNSGPQGYSGFYVMLPMCTA